MARLSKAEVEGHFNDDLHREIEAIYLAELAKIVCRGCGRFLASGEDLTAACARCGVAGRFENLHHNEAVQATRTEAHALLRDRHPRLRADSEATWSVVDGSTSDSGHHPELGVVHRAGFKHDAVLEQKLRDEARAKGAAS